MLGFLAAIFLPLIGVFIAGFFGRFIGDRGAQLVTCAGMIGAAVSAWWILFEVGFSGNSQTIVLFTWLDSGTFEASWALRFDTLSAVMIFVVNSVSCAVHIYSVGYMSHDKAIPRFMAYLSMFTFFMLMLVTADNLVQMFFGWEGVGVASYLLIGFWFDRQSANAAAMKAFLVNRVGDLGFALGIFACYKLFGTIELTEIFAAAEDRQTAVLQFLGMQLPALEVIAILLFIGACGKSAQLGLHTWLPDAMEGPTPVSALIHAATMVTAGVFMVARMSPVFEFAPVALIVVTVVGASTALFAATVGVTQNDIKRVIAYSTCSQLGYMFFACGVSAYSAAIFHLTTHAFFKALLFLGAGSVIHAMSDEQDMRKMGGIWRQIPMTYSMMWIGSLALAGVGIPILGIGFAGFYSKDIVLEAAFADHSWQGSVAFWFGIIAAFLTAFYSWRLLFMTFHGKPRADEKVMAHVHESPWVMLGPLVFLSLGAVFSGALLYKAFVGHDYLEHFWHGALFVAEGNDTVEAAHHVPSWVKILPIVVGLAGIGLAWYMYVANPRLPGKVASRIRPLYLFSFNKWYFDELYDAVFVRPAKYLAQGFWKTGDETLINGLGPDGVAAAARDLSRRSRFLQSGYVYHYAFAMLIGVVVLVSWYMFTVKG